MKDINKQIKAFVKSIDYLWTIEALDGDETEEIANKVLAELNKCNGNW